MANQFSVSPMVSKIELKAGETYTGKITVANPAAATDDLYYKISLSPYSVSDTNYTPDFQTISDWSKIVEWIVARPASGVLKPNETAAIEYTITVPTNAPAGGQYAMIGVSSNPPLDGDQGGTVQNVFEMASLIYANIDGETKHEGKILKNEIPGFVYDGKPKTKVAVENNGNVHESAYTTLSVKNVLTGQELYPANETEGTMESLIMPETTREMLRDLDMISGIGVFEVKQVVSYLGEESSTSMIMVVCPIWFIVLVAATFISICSLIGIGKIRRRKKLLKKSENDEKPVAF